MCACVYTPLLVNIAIFSTNSCSECVRAIYLIKNITSKLGFVFNFLD